MTSHGSGSIGQHLVRIRAKLDAVVARGLQPFGSSYHGFRLNSPIAEPDVAAIEAAHGIVLPEGYRAFITRVADGGAGPFYGLLPLAEGLTYDVEEQDVDPAARFRTPFPYTDYHNDFDRSLSYVQDGPPAPARSPSAARGDTTAISSS